MKVLVTGARGTTGSEVVRQLTATDVGVRAMTRSANAATRLGAAGVEVVVADLADVGSLQRAVTGVDAVYVATSASPELAELEGRLARAAAAAGVRHLVKLSVIDAAPDSPLTFARLHHAAEQQIKDSGIPWTMVRANGFMQNTLLWASQLAGGTVYAPVADARWSIVDVRDIAAVAVAALLDAGRHIGNTYACTGPQASSPREQVTILADVLGRPLDMVEVTIEQARQVMLDQGVPAWSADKLGELLRLYADGLAERVTPDVERVTGRAARDYRMFATDHRGLIEP